MRTQALNLMQALGGVISPNFRMVSIADVQGKLLIEVVLEHEDDEDFDEIEDLKDEFEVFQEAEIDYDVRVRVTDDTLDWPKEPTVVVFRRREK
ncbi:hypothetical protein [Aestuariispira ectoiniformans]|uniref:hypothetical protein n=1 Tax=Aestuariispira ectoiniformans TaxID=2775080 RepID=UPI00223C098A|nr:hypothetical protein [Aestuariispira ectoiniformans]